MAIKRIFWVLALSFTFNSGHGQVKNIFLKDSTPRKLNARFKFTEGPAVDRQGNIYFTDQPNNRIWKYDTKGHLSVFMEPSGRSNGLYFDRRGNLLACADEKNELWSISPDKKVTVLLKDFKGHQLNGPNDLWVSPDGTIYFTDPYFQRDYWKRTHPDTLLGGERLYRIPGGHNQIVLADSDLIKPNGVVGTPDGKKLFVAEMGKSAIYQYDIRPDGSLQNRKVFAKDLADGMTLDDQGNLYLAGNGITVYNKQGLRITHIPIPEKWTANVCFGGAKKNLLFITASESVYVLLMNVKGVE